MNIVITTCVVIVTITFVLLALQLIETLKQVKNTAFQIEKLASNANERLKEIEPAFQAVNSITNVVTSGWLKLISFLINLLKR